MNHSKVLFPRNLPEADRKLAKEILDELESSKADQIYNSKSDKSVKLIGVAVSIYDYMTMCDDVDDKEDLRILHLLFEFNWPKKYTALDFRSVNIIKIDPN